MEKLKEGTKSRLSKELKYIKMSKHKNIISVLSDKGNLLRWTATFRGP